MNKIALLSLFLVGEIAGEIKEVIRVFAPVSYHDTDSLIEFGVKGEPIQAGVTDRSMVLSGAFPEDLVKAVAMPFKIESNNPSYDVPEANLLILSGLALSVLREDEDLKVVIDCSGLIIPELVELTARQILSMSIESIRRTVRIYYQEAPNESFNCHLSLQGLPKEHQALQSLDTVFLVGNE